MILVVADDLSGAAELAGFAASRGLRAEVWTEAHLPESAPQVDVLALDTNTRLLEPDAAAQRVRESVTPLLRLAPEAVYKKTDSVLRGHVLKEVEALREVLSVERVLLVPANPSRHRLILDGRYQVEGQPLHETVFARDPRFPAHTSDVRALLQGGASWLEVPDVRDTGDLHGLAGRWDESILAAGGLDFFQALLHLWKPGLQTSEAHPAIAPGREGARTLWICGSLASWQERVARAERQGIPVLRLPEGQSGSLPPEGPLMLGLGEDPLDRDPEEWTRELAQVAAGWIQAGWFQRVFCEGGATAAALLHASGATRFPITGPAPAGVGALSWPGELDIRLYIKPGSYAWPEEVWEG